MHSLNIFNKAQINKVQIVSEKVKLHRQNSLTKAMYGLFNYIMEIAPDSLVRKTSVVISNLSILEHVHKRKGARYAKSQPLFLQMSLHKVACICTVNFEYANASFMLYTTFG